MTPTATPVPALAERPAAICSLRADLDTATVTVAGEMDHFTAAPLIDTGRSLLADRNHVALTVSLRDVTFADSALVLALELLHRAAAATGRELRIVDVPPCVRRVITLTQATELPVS